MAGTTSLIISNLLTSLERLSQFMPTFTSLATSSSSSIAHKDVTSAKVNWIQKRLMEDLKRLSRMLQRIQAVLHDAEEREIYDKAIQLWLSKLREVAYDAEDVLDQYDYQVIKTQLEGMSTTAKEKLEQVDDIDIFGYRPDPDEDFDLSLGRVSFEEGFALVFECPGMREWCQWHGFIYQDKDRTALMDMLEDWESDDSCSDKSQSWRWRSILGKDSDDSSSDEDSNDSSSEED